MNCILQAGGCIVHAHLPSKPGGTKKKGKKEEAKQKRSTAAAAPAKIEIMGSRGWRGGACPTGMGLSSHINLPSGLLFESSYTH